VGIEAVILKCTQGTTFLTRHLPIGPTEAAAAGLLVGAYHFFTTADATSR